MPCFVILLFLFCCLVLRSNTIPIVEENKASNKCYNLLLKLLSQEYRIWNSPIKRRKPCQHLKRWDEVSPSGLKLRNATSVVLQGAELCPGQTRRLSSSDDRQLESNSETLNLFK